MTFEDTFVEVMKVEYDDSKKCFIVCWKDHDKKENWEAVAELNEAMTLKRIFETDYGYRPVTIAAVLESTDYMVHSSFRNNDESKS